MTYRITLAEPHHVAQMVEITNREAERSAATVASSDEPVERWLEQHRLLSERYPWLVAVNRSSEIESQLESTIERDLENRAGSHIEDEVIGYAKAGPYNIREGFSWSVVLSVYLKPEVQGQGVAHQLYERLFALLHAQGYQRTYARIALPNIASRRLHERFGLSQTGILPSFAWKFNRWHDMAIYTGVIRATYHDERDDERDDEHLKRALNAHPERILSVLEASKMISL